MTTIPRNPAAPSRPARAALIASILAAAGGVASAQPASEPASPDAPAAAPRIPGAGTGANGRRPLSSEPTVLAFKNVPVEQVVPFIVECTGKVVLPQQDILIRRITLLNDQPIPRDRALDLVVLALQQAGVGVVETNDLVILRDIAEITRQDVPVIGPETSLLDRTDLGSIVEKVFTLHSASAENVGKIIKDSLPEFAKFFVDVDSNQIVVMGNVALLQRMERMMTALDRSGANSLKTETFTLQYADATVVADNIRELFSASGTTGNATRGGNQGGGGAAGFLRNLQGGGGNRGGGGGAGNQGRGNQPGGAGGARPASPDEASPSANLRVTANVQQNSVTVLAEPAVLDQIRKQVTEIWDRSIEKDIALPKVYQLANSDPVKVRDVLEKLLGKGGTTGGQGGAASQSVGRLAGQYSFEAIPESNRLLVVARSPDNLAVIDQFIEQLDKPLSAGLPRVVELKHANAEELAEQLNALLAQEGTLASIPRAQTGLTTSATNVSPFASDNQGTTTTNNQQNQNAAANQMTFWWQRARVPTDNAGSSNLVSKLRIVPVWRQNAVMIMAAPEYQNSLVELIESLDKPGRQVLISAVVAEITLDDATALGLRFSNSAITPALGDNVIGANLASQNVANDVFPGLFDTSVLNLGVSVNMILQALNQKTGVNILSEPKIFTSDNQEATFFDGQDIPFITDTQTGTNDNLIQSFDYRAVGIQLRVRPRITINRDVDLRVDLELSSIQPNQTLFGGFIVDRRQTTTQLIVKDNQTIVISGILRSEDSSVLRKVPLLGDIPLIGPVFQSTDKTKTKTEIVAFITPLVVNNTTESDELNTPYRQRLEQLRQELTPEANIQGQPITDPSKPAGEPAKDR